MKERAVNGMHGRATYKIIKKNMVSQSHFCFVQSYKQTYLRIEIFQNFAAEELIGFYIY